MDARKNLHVNNPVDRFHHLKQLISFPAISEVVFLFQVCTSKESQAKKREPAQAAQDEPVAAGKSAGK
jgi:hypothetical protein